MKVIGRKDEHGNDLEVPDNLSYAEFLKSIGGGLATCGEHLGVMVSPKKNVGNCPPGWAFVEIEESPEIIREALEHVSEGRKHWPVNDDKVKK
ncbi:MAG: hypothetical protein M0R80_02690 [Proteobacteria bacterium]|jgi:hypothetical protein|nr:hypothetical protein [Pseudomonadota bacterium]